MALRTLAPAEAPPRHTPAPAPALIIGRIRLGGAPTRTPPRQGPLPRRDLILILAASNVARGPGRALRRSPARTPRRQGPLPRRDLVFTPSSLTPSDIARGLVVLGVRYLGAGRPRLGRRHCIAAADDGRGPTLQAGRIGRRGGLVLGVGNDRLPVGRRRRRGRATAAAEPSFSRRPLPSGRRRCPRGRSIGRRAGGAPGPRPR
jgi:hypothetical protein